MTPKPELPQELKDGAAYCLVFYGSNGEYLLMALVLARRLALLQVQHPMLVLPTDDVPAHFFL